MKLKIFLLFFVIVPIIISCQNSKHIYNKDLNLVQDTTTSSLPDSSILMDRAKGKRLLEDCAGSELKNKIDTFWTPSNKEYQDLELNLFKLNSQIKHLNNYIIQYIGIIFQGTKYIYLNAFDKRDLEEQIRVNGDLSASPVVACGGGARFWRVLYDVNLKEFKDIQFNTPK